MAKARELCCDECKETRLVREGETLEGWLVVIPAVWPMSEENALLFCRPRCLMRYFERRENVKIRAAQKSRRERARARPVL